MAPNNLASNPKPVTVFDLCDALTVIERRGRMLSLAVWGLHEIAGGSVLRAEEDIGPVALFADELERAIETIRKVADADEHDPDLVAALEALSKQV